ncbi:MAG: thiamine diphosphokinase [Pseudomonadota bacterium]
MIKPLIAFNQPVTLVGGGEVEASVLSQALALAPHLVAADGAADRLHQLGHKPDAVIGDFDSLVDPHIWQSRLGDHAIRITDQNSSDFDKCLETVTAPLFIAVGFTGGRLDHFLYAIQAAAISQQKIIFLDTTNCLMPLDAGEHRLSLSLESPLSLIPLWPVMCQKCRGLYWDISGKSLSPTGLRSLSNTVSEASVELSFDQSGAILVMENEGLRDLYKSVF